MKNRIILTVTTCLAVLTSCVKDDGNYDGFHPTDEMTIEIYDKGANMGEELVITPTITFKDANFDQSNLRYEWRAGDYLFGTERELRSTTIPIGTHKTELWVQNTRTNIWYHSKAKDVSVYGEFQFGWAFIYADEQGKSEIGLLSLLQGETMSSKFHTGLYKRVNESELGGKPLGIQFHSWNTGSGVFFPELAIYQEGGVGPVEVNQSTLEREVSIGDEFIGGSLPQGFNPIRQNSRLFSTIMQGTNGEIFFRNNEMVANYSIPHGTLYPSAPMYYANGLDIQYMYDISRYMNVNIMYSSSFFNTVMYDRKNRRFIYCMGQNTTLAGRIGSAMTATPSLPSDFFNPTDMGDVDMLATSAHGYTSNPLGLQYNIASVVKNNSDEKLYLHIFGVLIHSTYNFYRFYPKTCVEFSGASLWNAKSQFQTCIIDNINRVYAFFTGGANNDKLYVMDISTNNEPSAYREVYSAGAEIVKIGTGLTTTSTTVLESQYRNKLAVCTKDGKITILDIAASNVTGTGSLPIVAQHTVPGSIVDITFSSSAAVHF